jgi:hypothetical protein
MPYTFQTFVSPPGTTFSAVLDIDNLGRVLGYSTTPGGDTVSWIWNGSAFTLIAAPGYATTTQVAQINDAGHVVGTVGAGAQRGFLWDGTTFTFIDPPGATTTQLLALNASDVVGGTYQDGGGVWHAFLYNGVTYTDIVSSAGGAAVRSVNASGVAAGDANGVAFLYDGAYHALTPPPGATALTAGEVNASRILIGLTAEPIPGGFRYDGTMGTVTIPEALATAPTGINAAGQICGFFVTGLPALFGFVRDSSTDTVVTAPGLTLSALTAINDHGVLVGLALASPMLGFVATPVVPLMTALLPRVDSVVTPRWTVVAEVKTEP